MKALMFYALVFVPAVVADDMTPEKREKLLKATADIVTVKVDEFEKRVRAAYSGSVIHMPTGGGELEADAIWPEKDIQQVTFLMRVSRVEDDWRWLKFNDMKLLVDGERVKLDDNELSSDVFSSGKVYEAKSTSLDLESLLKICAAEKVKMKLGGDEWEWTESHKLPLVAVLGAWMARGGDASAYPHLLKRIARPGEGTAFADVVKKFGEPVWRDPETGWATWEWFWVRFKDGKVIETRPRPIKEKAAQ